MHFLVCFYFCLILAALSFGVLYPLRTMRVNGTLFGEHWGFEKLRVAGIDTLYAGLPIGIVKCLSCCFVDGSDGFE